MVKLQTDKLISRLECWLVLIDATACRLLVGSWGRVVVPATKKMPSRSPFILHQPQQHCATDDHQQLGRSIKVDDERKA